MKRLRFEKAFLLAACDFLRCRLILMGGQVDDERCDTPQAMEGALLGMLDWKGEMRIMSQDAQERRKTSGCRIPPLMNRCCVALDRER